jgi:hypothetical protein
MLTARWGNKRLDRRAFTALAAVATVVLLLAIGMAGLKGTSALFTNDQPVGADLAAANIFRGDRDTPAFVVTDVSSGSSVDGTSALAVAGDSRYFTSWVWPAAFDGSRYLEADLSHPLPAGLTASGAQLTVRLSSNSSGTACYYVEVRRASSGALLSTHGSSGSPLDCVTGTTFATANVSISAVNTTDIANDLRIRVYARDSAAAAVRIDRLVVSGSTPFSSFTLFSVLTRDVHDGQADVIPWGLAAQ